MLTRLPLAVLLFSLAPFILAADAERPVTGGLGVTFGSALTPGELGAEVDTVAFTGLPDGQPVILPELEPGTPRPWRFLVDVQLPHPFRPLRHESYVMVDANRLPMRVVSRIDYSGCGEDVDWLETTLRKKYEVRGELLQPADAPFEKSMRIVAGRRQIDVLCGPHLIIDYADYGAMSEWSREQARSHARWERENSALADRRLILERRRATHFADRFTLGDKFRLTGAFGIVFQQPFAAGSTQQFPVDTPFIVDLPELPDEFAQGEIRVEIGPDRKPITVRGRFTSLQFDTVAEALKAKYGSPMKASERHVIHKVSGNHAILKRLDEATIELAFIDIKAQTEQRQRRWEKESEGL